MPGLRRENFEEWCAHLQNLETLIIFRAPEMNKEAVEVILDSCPNLRRKFNFLLLIYIPESLQKWSNDYLHTVTK